MALHALSLALTPESTGKVRPGPSLSFHSPTAPAIIGASHGRLTFYKPEHGFFTARSGTPRGHHPIVKPRVSKPATLSRQSKADHVALNRALSAFVDSGSLENAVHLFENMPRSDAYTWNVLIRGFVNNGLFREAIELYRRMAREGITADNYTFPFVVKACGGCRL
ncbi:hypothetical protein NL676_038337 [Syzygium grande]|nr:hypothetical protein NL676_038337 [Syzygium grande]